MPGGALRIALSASLHVLTGLVQTVCVQALLYSGGGDRSTLLLALPNYVGITLLALVGARFFRALDALGAWSTKDGDLNRVHTAIYHPIHAGYALLPTPSAIKPPFVSSCALSSSISASSMSSTTTPLSEPTATHKVPLKGGTSRFHRVFHPERRKLFLLAFNEIGGFVAGITGIAIAGSGLYQVVFSGGTVFTAILSVLFLRKKMTLSQWIFVAVITLGLMATAEQVAHDSANSKSDPHATDMISGVAFVLVSCLFYSLNYVLAEHFLDTTDMASASASPHALTGTATVDIETSSSPHVGSLPPPSGLDLSLYTGGSCLVVFGLYVLLHTVPNWNKLVTSSIRRHHGNSVFIFEQYLYIAICSFLHSLAHYDVIATVGAVPVGVLNAIRAVSVFAVSSILFCEHQASQCYSSRKGISTAIVIAGAVGYSIASSWSFRRSNVPATVERRTKHRRTPSLSFSRDAVGTKRPFCFPFLSGSIMPTFIGNWPWFGNGRSGSNT